MRSLVSSSASCQQRRTGRRSLGRERVVAQRAGRHRLDAGVVEDDQSVVAGAAHVELDHVRSERDRRLERLERVADRRVGRARSPGAAMGDDQAGAAHPNSQHGSVRGGCEHVFDGIADSAYVELHCHSAFSFLDGASLPDELVPTALELGYRSAGSDRPQHGVGLDGVRGLRAGARAAPDPRRRGRPGPMAAT